jgi:hypothetical protein
LSNADSGQAGMTITYIVIASAIYGKLYLILEKKLNKEIKLGMGEAFN